MQSKEAEITYKIISDYEPPKIHLPQSGDYYKYVPKTAEEVDMQIEYDMDEEDFAWLELMNERRVKENLSPVSEDIFELAMDRFEKESFFQCESLAIEGSKTLDVDEDAVCSVCGSGESESDNSILFCDLCNIAVHQQCYGVPRVPAGPWACRRCTLSPSRAVECCLCPNGSDGCAMKPTEDGRWAHVSCALWIPEVSFGCSSVREPVIGISRVAAARWKLTCYVCDRRGNGACLQCRRTSCYTPFHVSCAIRAGLCVGLPPNNDEGAAVFCHEHSAPAVSSPEAQRRLTSARKALSDIQSSSPPLSIPVITSLSLSKIRERVDLDKKDPFVNRLHCYWTLKRRSRNGAPLLRSMRYSMAHLARQKLQLPIISEDADAGCTLKTGEPGLTEVEVEEMVEQLKCWKRLRQDLEKVRLLLELIRKRERLKNEKVKAESKLMELKLHPLVTILSRTLDELYRVDCDGILSSNAVKSKASDKRPSSLTAIRERVMNHSYKSIEHFEADLEYLLDVIPGTSLVLREKTRTIVASMKKLAEAANYDFDIGTHRAGTQRSPSREPAQSVEKLSAASNSPVAKSRKRLNSRSVAAPTTETTGLSGNARPRGRPKKRAYSQSADESLSPSSENRKSTSVPAQNASEEKKTGGASSAAGGKSAAHSAPTPSAAGVNRRTAVLFGNKRRPGRPPKIASSESPAPESSTSGEKPAKKSQPNEPDDGQEAESAKTSAVENPSSSSGSVGPSVKQKRSRKKRPSGDGTRSEGAFGIGARWSDRLGISAAGADWGLAAAAGAKSSDGKEATTSSKSHAPPAKESFRQYRDMNDSDAEPTRESDHENAASEQASSSEDDGSSSSQSDKEEGDSSSSSDSDDDDKDDDDDDDLPLAKRDKRHSKSKNLMARLSSLDLVWAKCSGFPWYPAQVIDPEISKSSNLKGPVPVPPVDIVKSRPKFSGFEAFLVMFFDPKRTWKWLPRNKLDPLGIDLQLDRICLAANNKPNVCSAVKRAYDRAIDHRNQILSGQSSALPSTAAD